MIVAVRASSAQSECRNTSSLALDCIARCLEYISNKNDLNRFRLTSRACHSMCDRMLQTHFDVFLAMPLQQRFRTKQDIFCRVKLISDLYVPIASSLQRKALIWVHQQMRRDFLRGFDSVSRRPFLSVRMFNDFDWRERTLFIFVFDEQPIRINHTLFIGNSGL